MVIARYSGVRIQNGPDKRVNVKHKGEKNHVQNISAGLV